MSGRRRIVAVVMALVTAALMDVTGFVVLYTYAATPAFQLNLGQKYLDIGNYSEAILAFNRVLAITPNTVQAYLGLAEAYEAGGDRAKAVQTLRTGLTHTNSDQLRDRLERLEPPTPAATPPVSQTPLPERTLGEGDGYLSGRISVYLEDGAQRAIPDATVTLIGQWGEEVQKSDDTGGFRFTLPAGTYDLKIEAVGYHALRSYQLVGEGETTYTEHFMLIDQVQTGEGIMGGIITDAITGQGLTDANVRLRPNWNNPYPGSELDGSVKTDENGYFELRAPTGYYTAVVQKSGYISTSFNVTVTSGWNNLQQNVAVSPDLPEDQMRIVLRWGEHPSDLDSHLRCGVGENKEVFFRRQSVYDDSGAEIANLDVDDTTSYGPETVTILRRDEQTSYSYFVHDYSNLNSSSSQALSFSGAVVSVYVGGRLYQEFQVPTGVGGNYWEVFRIEGELIAVNELSYQKIF